MKTERWEKIEKGWYEHSGGAIVQWWRNDGRSYPKTGWYAWRAGARDDDYEILATMREAKEWALADGES